MFQLVFLDTRVHLRRGIKMHLIYRPFAFFRSRTQCPTGCEFSFGCVVVLYLWRRALGSRNSYSLPPGPPGIPWVGNVIGVNDKYSVDDLCTVGNRFQYVHFHVPYSSLSLQVT
ncbi:hypothetical protein L210DRAFT_3542962 [Boletus edulis BED1]|uniref:Uncharacterized protein n=1 Tax=Boletus edulis BED1 TaxID=1328754 RepID=A0AAD4BAZ5_BOLED|nr:hypothetical protein L210DRAFT_3582448 [Boletus edulis BED1]KAF8439006.1 hypothetical protein L210DRAFT_3542962 [Boletus edulis BED1]